MGYHKYRIYKGLNTSDAVYKVLTYIHSAGVNSGELQKKERSLQSSFSLLLLLLKTLLSQSSPIYWTKYFPTFIQQIFSTPYLTDIWHTWGWGAFALFA